MTNERKTLVWKTRCAQLIAQEEGFNVPGSIPWRYHNPGDLRHAPHLSHDGLQPNAVGIEPDDQTGVDDLERQLELYAQRHMTIGQMVNAYAPESDNNNTAAYLAFICKGLGNMKPTDSVEDALKVKPI